MCWNKRRLCWKTAKLFYFCHLKKLVRPETFGPYHVPATLLGELQTDVCVVYIIMFVCMLRAGAVTFCFHSSHGWRSHFMMFQTCFRTRKWKHAVGGYLRTNCWGECFLINGEEVEGQLRTLLMRNFKMCTFRRVLACKCKKRKWKGVRAEGHVPCTEDMRIYLKCKFN